MSYNDDAKMKLLKEAWTKMSEGEGDATYGAKVPGAKDPEFKGIKTSGTAVKQLPARTGAAKPPAGVKSLSEGEDDLAAGTPVGAADAGAGADLGGAPDMGADLGGAPDMGADLGAAGAAPVGSPWDQLVAAVEQMKVALEAIAAEEAGEAGGAVGGAPDMGAEGDLEDPMGGAAPEEDIAAVAEQYLSEAKKKLKEKKACKEEACEEGASKAKAKGGFIPGKKRG